MTKNKHSFIVLLISLLLGACSSKESGGCPQPPKSFSKSDLIGSWKAIDALRDSTIIIREEGLYKQTTRVKRTGFSYESEWLPWRVTYSEKGLPYLHLEGLLMCAYWYDIDCTTNVGPERVGPPDTKDPFADETYWYDFCQKKWVDTPGEGVFMVLGVPARFSKPPRGISLVPFTKSAGLPTGPTFELWEP